MLDGLTRGLKRSLVTALTGRIQNNSRVRTESLKTMKKVLIAIIFIVVSSEAFSQHLLTKANNEFSFKIYNATKPDSSNFLISPFSLNVALSMANEGAGTSTRAELDSLLCIKRPDNFTRAYNQLLGQTLNLTDSTFKACAEFKNDKKVKNELLIANSLWVASAGSITPGFMECAQGAYHSDIFSFDKRDLGLADKQMNQWLSKNTNERIPEIKGFSGDVVLRIVNAIYFMGEWDLPFDKKKTRAGKFNTLDRRKVDVKFMKKQDHYLYYEDSELQSIHLPYHCDQFSMVVILPRKKDGLLQIENKLSTEYLAHLDRESRFHEVKLTFPKFRIESEIFPKDEIIEMGYPIMFSDRADFSGISTTSPLKISEVAHKTFIEIDEKKTVAAAVSHADLVITGYGGGPTAPPPPKVFDADHPFVFFIIDNRTEAILFIGRFVDADQ
jgi:serpin B